MPPASPPGRQVATGEASVVILGAGFAGLRAALGLAAETRVRVTLVDRSRAPAIKTRLHELRDSAPAIAVADLFEQTRVRFLCGEVTAIDRARRRIRVDGEWVPYDWLILALGSRTSDLGIEGVREHALVFDAADDTRRYAKRVERLERGRGRLAVVGAGATGIEAATEAAERLGRGRVILVEAADRILPGFARLPALYAASRLRWLGVEVHTGARVEAVETKRILLAEGEPLRCDAVAWCAGIEPPPLLAEAELAPPGAPAAVDRFLVSREDRRVYVVGDCAAPPEAEVVRPSAQLAVQQGDFVAADVARRLRRARREPYHGVILGEFLSLGLCDATGKIHLGPLTVPVFGPAAWAAKQAGALRHGLVVKWASRMLGPPSGDPTR